VPFIGPPFAVSFETRIFTGSFPYILPFMDYLEAYNTLKSTINYENDRVVSGEVTVLNFTFESTAYDLLTGHSRYVCDLHGLTFDGQPISGHSTHHEKVDNTDSDIEENRFFRYSVFFPGKPEKAKRLILFFHGFNERSWDKYYPWARMIAKKTGKAVVLFPIAFHMNRAPAFWSDKRKMFELSQVREKKYPNLVKSSFSNVAISVRLHTHPDRFIWSGLETYNDIIHFVALCKAGLHPLVERECSYDFFSYSIGSLLAEILKLTNHQGYFTDSKLCMFCGGAVFNRLAPVSKFILDSEANVALYSYLVEHIDSHKKKNPRLRHYLSQEHPEGFNFYSMLDYKINLEYREGLFRSVQDQVYAIALKQDKVVPSYEVVNTLQGIQRDIRIPVDTMDFPYPYSHENPFPSRDPIREDVDAAFSSVFTKIGDFLK